MSPLPVDLPPRVAEVVKGLHKTIFRLALTLGGGLVLVAGGVATVAVHCFG